ncbi:MAG: hypothetical protein WCS31_02660 [Verrucomicrobiae bacterium]
MSDATKSTARISRTLHYSDAEFLDFEQVLKRSAGNDNAIWRRRVTLYLTLAAPANPRKRYRFGVTGSLVAMICDWLRARPTDCVIPANEYLVLIYGTSSKEYDSLKPVARNLLERGRLVTVMWVTGEPIPPDLLKDWGNADVVIISGHSILAEKKLFPVGAWFHAIGIALRAAFALRQKKGAIIALWHQRASVITRLVSDLLWMDFFTVRLATCDFRGVAFVSDTSEPCEALANYAIRRQWVSHHFLHGFANLVHTRTLADQTYCFSSVEREMFVASGYPPANVFSDGHPRQARIMSEIAKKRAIQPGEGGLRILFANQGVEGDFDTTHHRETMDAVFNAIRILNLGSSEFRIRLHPKANRDFDLAVCDAHSISHHSISTNSLTEDLAWANVLIVPWSTMAVEAAYAGCFLIWLVVGTFRFPVREGLIAAGFGEKATTADELISLLNRCRNRTVRSELISAMMSKALDLGIVNPGAVDAAASRMEMAR